MNNVTLQAFLAIFFQGRGPFAFGVTFYHQAALPPFHQELRGSQFIQACLKEILSGLSGGGFCRSV